MQKNVASRHVYEHPHVSDAKANRGSKICTFFRCPQGSCNEFVSFILSAAEPKRGKGISDTAAKSA